MKKYLLVAANTTQTDYDDLANCQYVVGSYDTVEEARKAAIEDLESLVRDDAYNIYADEDNANFEDYVQERMNHMRDHRLEESDFRAVEDNRYIIDYDYENGWRQLNSYMLIKIGE